MIRRASVVLLALAAGSAFAQDGDLKKNPEKAIKEFSLAVERAPEDSESWHNLAFAYYRAKKWDDAAQAITKATTLNAGSARNWALAGAIASERGKGSEAVTAYEKAREIETAGGGVMSLNTANGLGKSYLVAERWQDAVDAYKQAYKLTSEAKGDVGPISNQIGTAYLKLGNTAEAAKWFERSVANAPDSGAANYNLGMMHRKTAESKGDMDAWKAAADAFKKAADAMPNDTLAQFFAGESLAMAGRNAEAKTYLQKYLAADPDGKKAVAKFGETGRKGVHGVAKEFLAQVSK